MSGETGTAKRDLRGLVLRGVGWIMASQVAIQLLSLATSIVIARFLAPREVGLAAMGVVFVNLALLLTDAGLASALVQRAELSEDDKLTVARARKMQKFFSQPFFVASQFTGREGRYVKIADTIKGFKEIVDGKCDDMPEQAFYMVGTIEEAREKAAQLAKAS